jgi:PII-like signaling protein
MSVSNPGKILRIHFCETDTYQDKPLHEAILSKCREMKICGATVFRGLEGYGETAEIHKHHLMSHDQPVVLIIVDVAENIERLIPVVEDMMSNGVMGVSDVEMIRCQKRVPATHV